MLPFVQRIFFYLVAGGISVLILSLVRKRRLRENYTLLWLFISLMLVVIVIKYEQLAIVAHWLQANPSSLLMFCGMVALLLLVLQLCLMNSSQAMQIKNLAQKMALIGCRSEKKLRKVKKHVK